MNFYLFSMWCVILSLLAEVTNPSTSFVRDQSNTPQRYSTINHRAETPRKLWNKLVVVADHEDDNVIDASVNNFGDDLMSESILYVLLITPFGLLNDHVYFRRFDRNNSYHFDLRPVFNKPPVLSA